MPTINDLIAVEADLKRAESKIKRLRDALKPLAGIALWSDAYADCKGDHITDYNLSRYFKVEEIKVARAALEQREHNNGTD